MQTLAQFIERQTREAEPLPPDETLAFFEMAVDWLSAGSGAVIPLRGFFCDFDNRCLQQV
jgi:hypothetical protein